MKHVKTQQQLNEDKNEQRRLNAAIMDALDLSDSDTITLTKDELKTFMYDVSGYQTGWSDTSYRICIFLGIDPTEGF